MNWNCPHCNHNMVLTYDNVKKNEFNLTTENADWWKELINIFYICSNENCRKITLEIELYDAEIEYNPYNRSNFLVLEDKILNRKWTLIPSSNAKVFPDYIPKVLLDDYKEACEIKELSPKASATLSRRCLQWIIRDFWWISKSRLVDEINELDGKIDPLIFQAIDATRKIWNIWAHMEKDINLIIDVEPEEAEKLIKLIEILFKECYITKFEREKNLKEIIWISEEKEELKKQR